MEAAQQVQADSDVSQDHQPQFEAVEKADLGVSGKIEVLRCADLNVDPYYQRDLSRELVEKIKRTWDPSGAGYIVVNRRVNGALFIINGQHRVAARMELAIEAGDESGGEIVAQVFDKLTQQQEAQLRLIGNTKRTDTSQERFRAQVAAGDAKSLAIQDLLAQFQTRINPAPDQKHGINAVSAVEAIYDVDDGRLLTATIEAIKDAFGEVAGPTASVSMLKGTAWFLARHRAHMDRPRLVHQIGAEGADGIDRKARAHRSVSGGAGWMNYYRAMVEVYNHRLSEKQRIEPRTGGWSKGSLGGRSVESPVGHN